MIEDKSKLKTFRPLMPSSKFAICGLPLRVDTYRTCTFGCTYCFSNYKMINNFDYSRLQIANLKWLEKKLYKTYVKEKIDGTNFIDMLLKDRYTWHCGGMSDPFQPCEGEYHITKDMINITNKYNIHILFSTKSDTVYGANIRPDLHTFQLSVTNAYNDKTIEPGVPDIKKRYAFYRWLKNNGFRVGIRIQPFIPDVSTMDIIKLFDDADQFTLEGIKIVPQNKQQEDYLLKTLNIDYKDFTKFGLMNLKPEIRLKLYKPFIDYFEERGISYSIADNDLHYLGNNMCCCGDKLIDKSTTFNNTYMLMEYGTNYTKEQIDKEIEASGMKDCKCYNLFAYNRRYGCKTIQDFFDNKFDSSKSPFSPKFLYINKIKK